MDVVVDDVRLGLRVWPANRAGRPPALLLPATGETAEDWDTIAAKLSARRTVYAVDLRGHGRSDRPGRYGIDVFARDVIGVLDHLCTEPVDAPVDAPVDLVGHSLGGLVACAVAAERPRRVRRLVLEDIGFPHPRPPSMPARPDGELPFDWRMVEQVRPQIDDPDPGWAGIVARITAPTLLIAGGRSSHVPQEHVAELAGRLADARLTTIEAGHLVHAARPDEYLAELLAFLDGTAELRG